MEARSVVFMGFITVITLRASPCEALFFTRARKLHTNWRKNGFLENGPPSPRLRRDPPKVLGTGLPSRSLPRVHGNVEEVRFCYSFCATALRSLLRCNRRL